MAKSRAPSRFQPGRIADLMILVIALGLIVGWALLTPMAVLSGWAYGHDRPTWRQALKAWWGEVPWEK